MEPRLSVTPHYFTLTDQSRETGQWQPVGESGRADAQPPLPTLGQTNSHILS